MAAASGAVRLGYPWVAGRVDDPWEIEAAGPPLAYGEPTARPSNIVNIDEVELERSKYTVTASSECGGLAVGRGARPEARPADRGDRRLLAEECGGLLRSSSPSAGRYATGARSGRLGRGGVA